ncbi:hypothetical protein [Sphingobacterium sp. LRF_L2]|uniref:hypothetical protein n=1 Tax=Sphingobacterium sp. LRF_L2 TaxID=3369421 RepID=UPI003F5F5E51
MSLKKIVSHRYKDTDLLVAFTAHLAGDLHLARIRLICLFITALCKVKSINFVKVSTGFDMSSLPSSCLHGIQRVIANIELPMKPISSLIFNILSVKKCIFKSNISLDSFQIDYGLSKMFSYWNSISYLDQSEHLIKYD